MSMTRDEWDRRLGPTDNHPLAKTKRNMTIFSQHTAGWKYREIAVHHGISEPAVGKIVRRLKRRSPSNRGGAMTDEKRGYVEVRVLLSSHAKVSADLRHVEIREGDVTILVDRRVFLDWADRTSVRNPR